MKEKQRGNTTACLEIFSASTGTVADIPLIEGGISAGFPSPAQDFTELSIDLNKELIRNPSATFFGRVHGDSMQDAGIHHGDLVIIDKSIPPRNGNIAVCYLDGEFVMKRIRVEKDCCWLIAANEQYKPIRVTSDNDFIIWGIVIHVIKSF